MHVLSCLVSEGTRSVRSSQKLAERLKIGWGGECNLCIHVLHLERNVRNGEGWPGGDGRRG